MGWEVGGVRLHPGELCSILETRSKCEPAAACLAREWGHGYLKALGLMKDFHVASRGGTEDEGSHDEAMRVPVPQSAHP